MHFSAQVCIAHVCSNGGICEEAPDPTSPSMPQIPRCVCSSGWQGAHCDLKVGKSLFCKAI